MGKIRVKTFDETEQAEKDRKLEAKREAKKLEKEKAKEAAKEEHRETVVSPTSPETQQGAETLKGAAASAESSNEAKKEKKAKFVKQKVKGKRYVANLASVNKKQTYSLSDAVKKLKEFQKSKFDETVELHVNVKEKGISGQVVLPHGTGKKRRIKIADDATITDIEKGKIDFDVLVAAPQMMPKLAKVARVLGPRGLMPNPKNGTISPNPEAVLEKLSAGQVNYKTEAAAPIIHLSIGKISFEDTQITENVKAVLTSIGANKITTATIKSTMSPGVKISI